MSGRSGDGKLPTIKLFFQQRKHQTSHSSTKEQDDKTAPPNDTEAEDLKGQVALEEVDRPSVEREQMVCELKDLVNKCCASSTVWPTLLGRIESSCEKLPGNIKQFTLQLLLRIVKAEADRLQTRRQQIIDFSCWLGNDSFLQSLLACAVVYHQDSGIGVVEVQPFDVVLVIELVIRHAPTRSQSGLRRLQEWEESLLMSGVWATIYIYQLIEADRERISRDSTLGLDSPRKALISMTSNDGASGRVSRLELFFRKYFRLVVQRIDSVCRSLDLSEPLQEALWQAFLGMVEFVEPAYRLLHRRSLVQVLAALTYSVCKYYDQPRTFKQIIAAMPGDYKTVWMGEGEKPSDLVAFYNQIFLPCMQQIIHTLPALGHEEEPGTVPATPRTPVGPPGRRRRLSLADEHAAAALLDFPMPALHSPVMATSHLSKRVQLDMSPMRRCLSRNIPPTQSPTKLHLDTSGRPVVARRLHF